MQSFLLEILWLSVAPVMLSTMKEWSPFWQIIGESCRPLIEWFEASSPTSLLRKFQQLILSPCQLAHDIFWIVGLQITYGLVLGGVAAWRLRPAFRCLEGPTFWVRIEGRRKSPYRHRRLWPRPGCGDDRVLWKEMYLHRGSQLRRLALFLIASVSIGLLIHGSWDLILGAIDEVYHDGDWDYGRNQRDLNSLLRGANAVSMVVMMIGLASIAASSVTSEREGDTWLNLTASPLTGSEMIWGKILGALWAFRSIGYFLGVCWTFGLIVGSIHLLGFLASTIELAVFGWFIAALGVAISVWSKTMIRALTLTIGILLFTNLGCLFLLSLILTRSMTTLMGCMPFHLTAALVGVADLRQNWSGPSSEILMASIVGTTSYTLAAGWLIFQAIASYDSVVDRPDQRRSLGPERL